MPEKHGDSDTGQPRDAKRVDVERLKQAAESDNSEATWAPSHGSAAPDEFFDMPEELDTSFETIGGTHPSPETSDPDAPTVDPAFAKLWGTDFADSSPDQTLKSARQRPAFPIAKEVRALPTSEVAGYEFLKVLGEGGVGVVYEARQVAIDRNIAIKMIKRDVGRDDHEREKFVSEAVVTGKLDHPNIVPIHDLGAAGDGQPFYVMKMVKGTRWNDVIRKQSIAANLDILLDVCDAVAYAHSKRVIHRDLKPENVMLGEFGEVQVMDWGLGLPVDTDGMTDSTQTDVAGGTPAYMAPEMVTGEDGPVGVHSDVYLLGGILYEIVTGLRPHGGKRVLECLEKARDNEIQPTDQSGPLVDIALKALATDPAERYLSVLDLKAALLNYQTNAESINLTRRAATEFETARATGAYELYNRAIFGFQEALEMWAENDEARRLLGEAQLALAGCAFEKGDLDLAASNLDPGQRAHAELLRRIQDARQRRDQSRRRIRLFRNAAIGATAATILVLTVASITITNAKNAAVNAKELAVTARQSEAEQRRLAEAASAKAQAEEARAVAAKAELEEAVKAMMAAKTQEERAEAEADAAELVATRARDQLARSGMLLDASWWVFDADAARERQHAASREIGQPVRRSIALNDDTALPLTLIPAGEFVMGSPPSELHRAADEYLHRVVHPRPFYLADTEFTVAQWAAVLGAVDLPQTEIPAASRPMVGVTVSVIEQDLLPALQRFAPDGYRFALPSEAQWEFACRAGTASAFHSGETEADLQTAGWYVKNSDRTMHAVAEKTPNAFGLFDMHGNVGEICRDGYSPSYYLNATLENPVALTGRDRLVVRGGSVLNTAQHCRSAYRSFIYRANQYEFVGFRIALIPVDLLQASPTAAR